MPLENQKARKFRETWEVIFNTLKGLAPGVFGTKVFADVKFIGSDPDDSSKMIIEFNEEVGP